MSINVTKEEFEKSFKEGTFYNKQTQDENHLNNILNLISISSGMRILDLGCGTGYLSFPMAKVCADTTVVGLDIVTETLKENEKKARDQGLCNLEFVSYDGLHFPFEDNTFDLVVSRYALHHFPEIQKSIKEIARVLKPNGAFFVSDPRPNSDDKDRFVDDYMRLKKDGHIKFYTKQEWVELCQNEHMILMSSFDSEISFPKKKSTAVGFDDVIKRHEQSVIEGYHLYETENEIWITEQVNNLSFLAIKG